MDDPESCGKTFVDNTKYGGFIFGTIFISMLIK